MTDDLETILRKSQDRLRGRPLTKIERWWSVHRPNFETVFFVVCAVGVIAWVPILIFAAIEERENYKRLMSECMVEHREFECVSMLRRGSTAIIPMPFPLVVR